MPTRFGSDLYDENKPNTDAASVGIMRDAGAIIFGKTTTTEFTVLNKGPLTTNPVDKYRTPGGSAAGSAAAVADFQVPIALGMQSGGSIIRPASYTGIFAMKPTHNAVSTEGIKVVSRELDTCGFFARTVEDLELIATVFALEHEKDSTFAKLSALRIALIETPFFDKAGPGTREAMSRASETLKEAGVKSVEKVELSFEDVSAQRLDQVHKTVFGFEAKSAFLVDVRLDKDHDLDPKIRKYVEQPKYSPADMIEAREAYERMRLDFDKFAINYDAIITPSAVDVAPEGLDDMGAATFNFLWTGLQTPVVHVPAFVGEADMPVGISIISSRYTDGRLLRIVEVLSKSLMKKGGWKIKQIKAAHSQLPELEQQSLEESKAADSPWAWLRDLLLPQVLVDKL